MDIVWLSQNPSTDNPMVAFSYLHRLKVGDDIYLEIDGVEYHYRMRRSKIVDPNDLSIITGSKGSKTLTLFTCHKPGDNKERYVAIARLM
ncbi:MAG: sortase [Candidatus Dojkabacteria bacterium]|nr:sortase [Candidatus Dojkabacteria bacterium]